MKTEFIQSNGLKLHTIHHFVSHKAPCILWVHGFAEHCLRYQSTIEYFANKGYNSVAFDLRGHGQSEGTKAFINNFDEYLKDVHVVRNYYEQMYPQMNWYMVGHSMGGLVVIRYHQKYQKQASWMNKVVSSPLLGLAITVPAWKKMLSKLVVKLIPTFSIPSGIDPFLLSKDKAVCEAYKNDKRVLTKATAGWYEATMKAIEDAFHDAPNTPEGIHFLVAGSDKLVSVQATKQFYDLLPQNINSSFINYPDLYHEIFNEPEKELVYQDLLKLLQSK